MSRAPARISRSVPKPKREPNEKLRPAHKKFVALLHCVGCGGGPCEPAHVRMSVAGVKQNAMSAKPDDKFCVPLCRACHDRQHTKEGEPTFWARLGIDPIDLALRLWTVTGSIELGERAVFRARQCIALHQPNH